MRRTLLLVVSGVAICGISVALAWPEGVDSGKVLTGAAAFSTATAEKPGRRVALAGNLPYAKLVEETAFTPFIRRDR